MVVICLAEIPALTSIEEMRQNIRAKENNLTKEEGEKEAEEEEHEDANDIQVYFDGSADLSKAECNAVIFKDSVVLISQDDRVSGSRFIRNSSGGLETKNHGDSEGSFLFT